MISYAWYEGNAIKRIKLVNIFLTQPSLDTWSISFSFRNFLTVTEHCMYKPESFKLSGLENLI